jgi:hypothetical protein
VKSIYRSTRICYILRAKARCTLPDISGQAHCIKYRIYKLLTYILFFSPVRASWALCPRSPASNTFNFMSTSFAIYPQTDFNFNFFSGQYLLNPLLLVVPLSYWSLQFRPLIKISIIPTVHAKKNYLYGKGMVSNIRPFVEHWPTIGTFNILTLTNHPMEAFLNHLQVVISDVTVFPTLLCCVISFDT